MRCNKCADVRTTARGRGWVSSRVQRAVDGVDEAAGRGCGSLEGAGADSTRRGTGR
jgi:hypothetical protein